VDVHGGDTGEAEPVVGGAMKPRRIIREPGHYAWAVDSRRIEIWRRPGRRWSWRVWYVIGNVDIDGGFESTLLAAKIQASRAIVKTAALVPFRRRVAAAR